MNSFDVRSVFGSARPSGPPSGVSITSGTYRNHCFLSFKRSSSRFEIRSSASSEMSMVREKQIGRTPEELVRETVQSTRPALPSLYERIISTRSPLRFVSHVPLLFQDAERGEHRRTRLIHRAGRRAFPSPSKNPGPKDGLMCCSRFVNRMSTLCGCPTSTILIVGWVPRPGQFIRVDREWSRWRGRQGPGGRRREAKSRGRPWR